MDRPNPHTNRSAAYAHTFGANAVSTPATDMDTRDVSSIFLRPRSESASVVSRKWPQAPTQLCSVAEDGIITRYD